MKRRIFSDEHELFRASVHRFLLSEVAPHAARWRQAGIVDRDAWRKAGDQGLLLMWADAKYGGAGIEDFRFDQVLSEEWFRYGDPGFAVPLHNRVVAPYIARLGTEEQRARILPKCISGETILAIAISEPTAGSDVSAMRTRAEDKGDHWVLNGSKIYISNGILSDVVLVAARTNPDKPRSLGLFLVERGDEGFERGRKLDKMGLKSQDTAELFFKDVRVPTRNVLGDPQRGFYSMMEFLAEERIMSAIRSHSQASRAFDITLNFVKERTLFGRKLGAFQNTRFKLADMRAQLDMCQAFIDHCVLDHLDGHLSPDLAAEAKLSCSEVEGRVVDECLQLFGGAGYMDEYEISRLYTNSRVTRIYAGSSEVMREIIGRSLGLDERTLK